MKFEFMDTKANQPEGGVNMEMQEVARQNFVMWNEALQTKDPKKVAILYAQEATFLPTVSPKFKHGVAEAEDYFEHFLKKNPDGAIKEEKVQTLGDDAYLHSGMYDFEVDNPDGGRSVVEARFSFVWKLEQGDWRIIHHHSSVKPQA